MLGHWLLDTHTFSELDSLSTFQRHIPLEWIQTVLETTDKASIRRRKLPAELVVWLVVAMGLFRDRSITEVVRKLDLCLTDSLGGSVAPSAVPQARQRLTSEPLAELFDLTAPHWAALEDQTDVWRGLHLQSVDGTQFRTADTPAMAEQFGYVQHSAKQHTEYPVVRLCALTSLRSRLIHAVEFGPSAVGEVSYAKRMLPNVKDNTLTLFDRCYLSAGLLLNWQRQHPQSHWMVPLKSNTRYTIVETYADNDYRVEMKVSDHARRLDPTLPERWQARLLLYPAAAATHHIKGLLCSLTDMRRYPTQAVLDVYFERWEIESSYGELKHQMLDDRLLLRSQSVEGVRQEIWGILLAYNLVRVEIGRIAREAKVSPLRISFIMALRDIQDEVLWCAIASPGTIPAKLRAMRQRIKRYILPEKRKRPKPRTVRVSKTRYTIQSKHA